MVSDGEAVTHHLQLNQYQYYHPFAAKYNPYLVIWGPGG